MCIERSEKSPGLYFAGLYDMHKNSQLREIREMPKFSNPGAFFVGGTLAPSEQKFLKALLENAKKNGYERFVEPCSGMFPMSHLAVQAGFKPTQVEASDVSMISSIIGYAITGTPLDSLCLHAKGFSDEELLDPATALYAWKYLATAKSAGKEYFYNYLIDLQERRTEHISELNGQLEEAKKVLHGMSYRPLDMFEHLKEVIDDPQCVTIVNAPTYIGGYEKFFDTGGCMTWKEPEYGLFDPKTGYGELRDLLKDAKCLAICYQEGEPGTTAMPPIFGRYGVREGVNAYLTSNRPEEATDLANGKSIYRSNDSKLEPMKCSMLPRDYEITEKSKVQVCEVERSQAQYYRQLWTHNFVGSAAPGNYAVLIDGKIAGVFGIDKAALTMGAFGTRVSDAVFLMYGMTVPHKKYRLGRLLTMLAQNRAFIMSICNDIEKEKANKLKTVQMTRYPEAKENRGIMKLVLKKPDPQYGYRLTYESDLKDRTEKQTLIEWLGKEKKWRTERQKYKAQQQSDTKQ